MSLSESKNYSELLNAWKGELISKKLTPLNLNFISNFLFYIQEISTSNSSPVETMVLKRAKFLIHDLIELRKQKIITIYLKKDRIDSSYLSKQELEFYDFIKNSDSILQNKKITFSSQLLDFINKNSNITVSHSSSVSERTGSNTKNEEIIENGLIQVIFLKDVEKFIYTNNEQFGPFKQNDIAKIPDLIFRKVFLPKKIAKEIE